MAGILSTMTRKLHFWARFLEEPSVRRARALGVSLDLYTRFQQSWITEARINSIIDIGANTGQFAQMALDALPFVKLHAFEPLQECYTVLQRRLGQYPNAKTYNVALGSRAGRLALHRNAFTQASSFRTMTDLHKCNYPETCESAVAVDVPVRTLDSFAAELELPDNIMIKIDVQGYEDEVLHGGSTLIPRAQLVLVEVSFQSLYEGQPSFHKLYQALTRWGFEFRGCIEQTYSSVDGGVLQGDAVFVKSALPSSV